MADWLVVMSEDNWNECSRRRLLGLGRKAQQRIARFSKGDRVWVYVNKKFVDHQTPRVRRIRALATVAGNPKVLKQPSWHARGENRFEVALPITIDQAYDFPAEQLLKSTAFARRPGGWRAALLNAPIELGNQDIGKLRSALDD
jgi:predicted RNA-binding protein